MAKHALVVCLAFFIGALLIWLAIQLIMQVFWWLVAIIGVALLVYFVVHAVRARQRRW
ncbi:hypothetical protein [Mesorhizobium japonicum]|uniref:hypothetical protein n=1 Tax=Mesorhizobium japonicum TaxID=2066070 RepID=UPI003B5A70D4